jgi:dUTP pyrophosphatase
MTNLNDVTSYIFGDKEAGERIRRDYSVVVERIDPSAKLPTRAHPDDVGLDVYASHATVLAPFRATLVSTGIKIKPADGTWLQVESRSGLASNGISVLGGIIDSKYRGEVKVILVNHTATEYQVSAGDKVAQLVERHLVIHDVLEGTLDETERGANGFGSSGR